VCRQRRSINVNDSLTPMLFAYETKLAWRKATGVAATDEKYRLNALTVENTRI